ncbi:hypothetical protein OS493_000543 [Desmophyllum pertusum]|uniref:Myb/SANT-like DNA-binding domain-containing protein n=1 Tax=Desmophyllum pertusum TaxID=174260 RepID=A0A9X0A7F8_9CNID|nr:hypothetical protein OS493_000543 [Desmophyllum pertusum]
MPSLYSYETLDMEEVAELITIQTVQTGENAALMTSEVSEDEFFMRWTDESVKLLIVLYQVHEPKFSDVNYKNKSVWESIAAGMKDKGYHPTWLKTTKEPQVGERKLANSIKNGETTASSSGRGEITEDKSKVKSGVSGVKVTEESR